MEPLQLREGEKVKSAFFPHMRSAVMLTSLLMVSCVPNNSAYRVVPGLRGPSVTVLLDAVADNDIAPSIDAVPLTPSGFDPAMLPALDAVTNPGAIDPMTPLPEGSLTPAIVEPVPDFTAIPFQAGAAAAPFTMAGARPIDQLRAQMCLTAAIYYEAGNEPDAGQQAVAQVILNRMRHPAYPNTVCDVVYQGTERGDRLCQFTFGCDGSLARVPVRSVWARASRAARAALSGHVYAPVGLATHYHTLAVNPIWNRSLVRTAIVGAHIFFRWSGAASSPTAFYDQYRGNEPTPGPRAHPIRPAAPLPTPSYAQNVPAPVAGGASYPTLGQAVPPPPVVSARGIAKAAPKSVAEDNRYVSGSLPESSIRDEFRGSGQWIGR